MTPFDADRYSRQTRFGPLGVHGQERLAAARVAIVGCGALGSVSAMALARAGVGSLRLIDRDIPEWSNLPRQVLFDEADVAAGVPKAVAAAAHLTRINSRLAVDPVVVDLAATNAEDLLGDVDVIVDGTDNFEARFLINEVACRHGVPWVHGGAIGAEGRVLSIVPGSTACLRCLIPDPPAPGALPTCETAGILGPTALVVGAVQAVEVIKLIVTGRDHARGTLLVCDLWEGVWRTVDLSPLAEAGCATCRQSDYPWIEGRCGGRPTPLCGRDAVQVSARGGAVDLESLAARLSTIGKVHANRWMVRADVADGIQLAVFADGRAIVSGTKDEAKARAIVSRFLGA